MDAQVVVRFASCVVLVSFNPLQGKTFRLCVGWKGTQA